jgi:hypothetical protein
MSERGSKVVGQLESWTAGAQVRGLANATIFHSCYRTVFPETEDHE